MIWDGGMVSIMIIKFICWVWGHSSMLKMFTGDTMISTSRLTGGDEKVMLYKWVKQKNCIRCGKEIG